jgi:hypothetical protein
MHHDDVKIVDGKGETEVGAPTQSMVDLGNLPGYTAAAPLTAREYFDGHSQSWQIDAADEPYTIELPVERAGALYGQILDADGSPARETGVSVDMVHEPDLPVSSQYFSNHVEQVDRNGEFAVLPLPLNKTFKISASAGLTSVDEEVELTDNEPIARVQLRLPKTLDATMLVLQPDGQPSEGTPLQIDWPGHTAVGHRTDSEGICVVRGILSGEQYTVTATPEALYQPASTRLAAGSNVIRLKKGLSVEGKVLESGTEMPLASCIIVARLGGVVLAQSAETVSDSQGCFRFTNLGPGEYKIEVRSAHGFSLAGGLDERIVFTAGQTAPVIVHCVKRGPTGIAEQPAVR